MQLVDIPSPGWISNGHLLRQEAYKAINTARVRADITKDEATTGQDLRDFFLACAALCPLPKQPEPEPKAKPAKKETA